MRVINQLYDFFLNTASSLGSVGMAMMRVAILVIFVWIGGLKFWNYEAEGIVPFVANSPFMSFFYSNDAPEYKDFKLKEGEFDQSKYEWHVENNTYLIETVGCDVNIVARKVSRSVGLCQLRPTRQCRS